MNLKDKLSRLDRSACGDSQIPSTLTLPEDWIVSFQRELDARVLSEKKSFIVLKENYFPAYRETVFRKAKDRAFLNRKIHLITGESLGREVNWRKTLFLDLETTGLSGGTGTYAFLVGIGHLELDHIVVRQYLLPDFQHEWLLLKQVENALQFFNTLVTFNGKSFDVPLLRNRFVLNRMESVLGEMRHLDMLHASRRIWKRRLGACDLQSLEWKILGQNRGHDIPGELIPQIYFEYIRKRRAVLLRDVLEHNYHDIVNMILLTLRIGEIAEEPVAELQVPEDLLSLARFYDSTRRTTEAAEILEKILDSGADPPVLREARFLLSMIYKRKGEYQLSSRLIKELLAADAGHPRAIEELAKHLEHREKNYRAALELVQQALQHIAMMERLQRSAPILRYKKAFLHRRQRLLRRLKKGTNS